jgi:disulfide bond formation protein DsbB
MGDVMRMDGWGSRGAAAVVLAVAAATIAGALTSEYGFGLVPCKLCLWQRWPYYAGVPLAALTMLAPDPRLRRAGLGALALLFLGSAGLGAYHAGVEWGFWAGPADCGGGAAPVTSVEDLLKGIETTRVVSCTEAAWRFLGLSLAGWNALVSLGLAAVAAIGATRRWPRAYGSSSVSQ